MGVFRCLGNVCCEKMLFISIPGKAKWVFWLIRLDIFVISSKWINDSENKKTDCCYRDETTVKLICFSKFLSELFNLAFK